MEQQTQKLNTTLSKKALNLYGISDFGFSFLSSMENSWWTYYLTNVARLPLAGIGLMNTITFTGAIFAQTIATGLVSALKPMRWGKNSSYMIVFGPLVVLSFTLAFTKLSTNDTINLFIVGAGMLACTFTRMMTWASNLNMMNVLSLGSRDNRVMLASRRSTWSAVAGIVYSYTVLPFIQRVINTDDPSNAFTLIAFVGTSFYMVMNWVSVWVNKGYEYTGEAAKALGKTAANTISFVDLLKSVVQNPPLLTILIGAIINSSLNSASSSGITYSYRYIFDFKYYSMQSLSTAIVGAFASFFAGWAGKTFGSRNSVLIGQLGGVTCNVIIALFFAKTNPIGCIIMMCVARVFTSFSGANMQALYGDCVTYDKWKSGKDTSAMVMGSQSIPINLGFVIRGLSVPLILSLVNFNPDPSINQSNAPMELKNGIVVMSRWLPACGQLIYALILFLGFRMLNEEKMAEMQKDIDEREAAQKAAAANA